MTIVFRIGSESLTILKKEIKEEIKALGTDLKIELYCKSTLRDITPHLKGLFAEIAKHHITKLTLLLAGFRPHELMELVRILAQDDCGKLEFITGIEVDELLETPFKKEIEVLIRHLKETSIKALHFYPSNAIEKTFLGMLEQGLKSIRVTHGFLSIREQLKTPRETSPSSQLETTTAKVMGLLAMDESKDEMTPVAFSNGATECAGSSSFVFSPLQNIRVNAVSPPLAISKAEQITSSASESHVVGVTLSND